MNSSGAAGRDAGRGQAPSGRITPGPAAVVIAIRVPRRPEYIGIVRAACAQLAPLLGWRPGEIADLRLASDEACGFLVRNCITLDHGAGRDDLSATFVIDGPRLHVTLATKADVSTAPDDDEFGWAILTGLVDEFTWRVEESTVLVEIRKLHVDGRQE